jgi:predicted secreted protein
MSIVQFIVAYAVCWWLVLFMVLPHGLTMAEKPLPGNAPSAPENPRLKRKFRLTTLLAFIPTALIYLVATAAKAEDTIYHVGGGCEPLVEHSTRDDVAARDGVGVKGQAIAPATLKPSPLAEELMQPNIPLWVPSSNYLNADRYNVDMRHSYIQAGTLSLESGSKVRLNGKALEPTPITRPECTGAGGH